MNDSVTSSTTPADQNPFSARTMLILLVIGLISFGAVVVLLGWSPELRDKNRAGDHPYSTAATGYNGLVHLLEHAEMPVSVSRLSRDLVNRDSGVMVVALPGRFRGRYELEEFEFVPTTLLVLPKWHARPDRTNRKAQSYTYFVNASRINDYLGDLEINATLGRIDVPDKLSSEISEFDGFSVQPDVKLQVLNTESDELEAIIGTEDGALLSYSPKHDLWILSDPDMINTFGLSNPENARFALNLLSYLQDWETEDILIDGVLHGFERSSNLLQMMFDIPFIGATLTGLMAAFLLGWAALIRFGATGREGRAIALGKQALADSSAGLVKMAKRETRMAPGYLNLIKRQIAHDIGVPKTMTDEELSALLNRMGKDAETDISFSELEARMRRPSQNLSELLELTRALHDWRDTILRRASP